MGWPELLDLGCEILWGNTTVDQQHIWGCQMTAQTPHNLNTRRVIGPQITADAYYCHTSGIFEHG
jgi:hypothetical protein